MKAQNQTVEKVREMQVKNNEKFEDINQEAHVEAHEEWNPDQQVATILHDLEDDGNWGYLNCYWEIQENTHGKLDFFTVTGLPPVEDTWLSKSEHEEVRQALIELVNLWTQKLGEKLKTLEDR